MSATKNGVSINRALTKLIDQFRITYDSCLAAQQYTDSCDCRSCCCAWLVRPRSSVDSQCQSLVVPAAVATAAADVAADLAALRQALVALLSVAYSNCQQPEVVDHCDDDLGAEHPVLAVVQPADHPIDWHHATAVHPAVEVAVHSNHSVEADSRSMHSFAAAVVGDNMAAWEVVVPNSCNLVVVPTLVSAVADADMAAFAVAEARGDGNQSEACCP